MTLRPARIRGGQPYKIDARDPGSITVYLAHDRTPAERREIADDLDEDLRAITRRRRRAALEPIVELVGDEGLGEAAEATGTDGDVEREALARRATLRTVP